LYVAGRFRDAGSVAATNIARWDGTNWHAVGDGIGSAGGDVYALAIFRDQLYAGGIFRDAGNISCTNIARWNGREWLPLGAGLAQGDGAVFLSGRVHYGAVYALGVHRNFLCVGGNFFRAGDRSVTSLAFWD